MSMIIAVDFDGTIARSNYPVIQGEQPYAGEVLRQLHQDGHYIIIWTCRCGKPLLDAVNWLLDVARYGEGGNKVYAHVYIDDKNLGGFPGWRECLETIRNQDAEYQLAKMTYNEAYP